MFHVKHYWITDWSPNFQPYGETAMNQDNFNMSMRKFLKRVGVTSQREIETAVQDALASGKLSESGTVKVKMTLTIEGMDVNHVIEDQISLDWTFRPDEGRAANSLQPLIVLATFISAKTDLSAIVRFIRILLLSFYHNSR